MKIITIKNLEKYYGNIQVLKGVNLEIDRGEVFGFVGPNGSGKTTLLECIMGLRKFDGGEVCISNHDVVKEHKKIVYMVGAQLQESELARTIKVKEAIQLQAAIYNLRPDINELLRRFDLTDKGDVYYSTLSGGQKQKLFILLAQLHNPEILIFDELSTGLDPIARTSIWNEILRLKEEGKTILLSTHYMEEAEYVCDRIAMVFNGDIIDIGTPKELVKRLPFKYVAVMTKDDMKYTKMEDEFFGVLMSENEKITVYINDDAQKKKLLNIQKQGKDLELAIRSVNLEDYYQYKINEVRNKQ